MLLVVIGRASFSKRREVRESEDDRPPGILKPETWSSEGDGPRTPISSTATKSELGLGRSP